LVKRKEINNHLFFLCEVCNLGYSDEETARECKEWFKKTGTCSIKITKKVVYLPSLFKEKK